MKIDSAFGFPDDYNSSSSAHSASQTILITQPGTFRNTTNQPIIVSYNGVQFTVLPGESFIAE